MFPPISTSPSQHLFHQYHLTAPSSRTTPSSSSLNEQFLLSAAAFAASHSYPPPSSFLSSFSTSNSVSSHTPEQQITRTTNFNNENNLFNDRQTSPIDVKNLIGSSLTALGLDNVNEDEFDKAATTNEQNNNFLSIDDNIGSFERSTTPMTNNTSPTHLTTISSSSSSSTNPITRPVNIPHTFTNEHFSQSSLAKSPFDQPSQSFDESLESVCDLFIEY